MKPAPFFVLVLCLFFSSALAQSNDGLGLEEDEHGYWVSRSLTNNINVSSADWMRDSPWVLNRTLADITIPGTHDSGAYWLSKQFFPGTLPERLEEFLEVAEKLHVPVDKVVAAFALAQDRDFYDQAAGGIRYFDIRCGWNGSEWVTFHALQGHPIKTLLTDLRRFIDEHTHEVFVLEMSHFLGSPDADVLRAFGAMVQSVMGNVAYPPLNPGEAMKTIAQMIKDNTRVLITMEDAVGGGPYWSPSTIANSYANSDNVTFMEQYDDQQIQLFETKSWGGNPLFKISWTLTTQTSTVTHALLPGHPRSLKQLATIANNNLVSWATTHAALPYPRLSNIFILDFFEEVDIVTITQQQN